MNWTTRNLEEQLMLAKAEKQLLSVVMNEAVLISSMISIFYSKLVSGLYEHGFDLMSLQVVREVLSESHLKALTEQIEAIKAREDQIQQTIASKILLEDFQ